MGKRIVYTKITPLPSNVPRQLAIELLHSHSEVIELNPLVTGVKEIEAPRDSPNDEYFSQWYEISEIITWGFGLRKKINFKGVFHSQPYGLQSHVYAPMGVDLRNKYSIGGNQPGEPRETRELGVDTPIDGLYLREDVEIVCNLALASFVKKETKEATGKMIERLARKAELLDEGKLHAMFEDGKLKTSKPSGFSDTEGSLPPTSPPGSPNPSVMSGFAPPRTPRLDKRGFGNYHDVNLARQSSTSQHRTSQYMPSYQQQGYNGPDSQGGAELHGGRANMPMINELPADFQYSQPANGGLQPGQFKPQNEFRSELPGDNSFSTGTPSPQPSPRLQPPPEKPPVHQYQAYPAPAQQHPADRPSSLSVSGGAQDHRHNSYSSQTSQGSNIAEWQRNIANTSQVSVGRSSPYEQQSQSRPPSNLMPDHQRFSQMSIQQTPPQGSARPSGSYSGPVSNAKCPVCGLFEGDEAAVSHHVSKAHFS